MKVEKQRKIHAINCKSLWYENFTGNRNNSHVTSFRVISTNSLYYLQIGKGKKSSFRCNYPSHSLQMNYLIHRASFHNNMQHRPAVKLLISTFYFNRIWHRLWQILFTPTKQHKTKASFPSVNVFYHRCNGIISGNAREPVIYSLV